MHTIETIAKPLARINDKQVFGLVTDGINIAYYSVRLSGEDKNAYVYMNGRRLNVGSFLNIRHLELVNGVVAFVGVRDTGHWVYRNTECLNKTPFFYVSWLTITADGEVYFTGSKNTRNHLKNLEVYRGKELLGGPYTELESCPFRTYMDDDGVSHVMYLAPHTEGWKLWKDGKPIHWYYGASSLWVEQNGDYHHCIHNPDETFSLVHNGHLLGPTHHTSPLWKDGKPVYWHYGAFSLFRSKLRHTSPLWDNKIQDGHLVYRDSENWYMDGKMILSAKETQNIVLKNGVLWTMDRGQNGGYFICRDGIPVNQATHIYGWQILDNGELVCLSKKLAHTELICGGQVIGHASGDQPSLFAIEDIPITIGRALSFRYTATVWGQPIGIDGLSEISNPISTTDGNIAFAFATRQKVGIATCKVAI